ncbi:MAG: hypothetical protein RR945_00540 [Erysipelotrichaceae bacterium]
MGMKILSSKLADILYVQDILKDLSPNSVVCTNSGLTNDMVCNGSSYADFNIIVAQLKHGSVIEIDFKNEKNVSGWYQIFSASNLRFGLYCNGAGQATWFLFINGSQGNYEWFNYDDRIKLIIKFNMNSGTITIDTILYNYRTNVSTTMKNRSIGASATGTTCTVTPILRLSAGNPGTTPNDFFLGKINLLKIGSADNYYTFGNVKYKSNMGTINVGRVLHKDSNGNVITIWENVKWYTTNAYVNGASQSYGTGTSFGYSPPASYKVGLLRVDANLNQHVPLNQKTASMRVTATAYFEGGSSATVLNTSYGAWTTGSNPASWTIDLRGYTNRMTSITVNCSINAFTWSANLYLTGYWSK